MRFPPLYLIALWLTALFGCGPVNNYYTENTYILEDEAEDAPIVETVGDNDEITTNITCAELAPSVNILDTDGYVLMFDISDEQKDQMNEGWADGYGWGDYYVYDLDEGGNDKTYADHMYVMDRYTSLIADCGKVQVNVVGQSTGCMLGEDSCIPNLSVDVGEFQEGRTLGNVRRFRLNNNQVGNIYSEASAYTVLARMGKAVPRTTFGWVTFPGIWPEDTMIPYTVVEQYDELFVGMHTDNFHGGITAIWEGVGDFDPYSLNYILDCEYGDCADSAALEELSEIVALGSWENGFEATTAHILDWPSIKELQILHWILWIGDDYFHNSNNVVPAKMADGTHTLLGWSYDISGGQQWYTDVQLTGYTALPMYCQYDAACWDDLLARAPDVIDRFQAVDPASVVTEIIARVENEGMVREPDLRGGPEKLGWYTDRSVEGALEAELELYRNVGSEGCPCDTGNAFAVPPPGGGDYDTGCPCPSDTGWDTAHNDTSGYDTSDTAAE